VFGEGDGISIKIIFTGKRHQSQDWAVLEFVRFNDGKIRSLIHFVGKVIKMLKKVGIVRIVIYATVSDWNDYLKKYNWKIIKERSNDNLLCLYNSIDFYLVSFLIGLRQNGYEL